MSPDDLARFHAGETELFRHLVDRESPRLVGYARRLTRDADEARELAQRTWVRAFEKRRSFAGHGPLFAWLLSICRSLFHDGLRAQQREARLVAAMAAAGHSDCDGKEDSVESERSYLSSQLADAVGALPPQQRDVLMLRLFEGCSTRETAARLSVAEGTVKAALHHALRKLRSVLSGADYAD